MKVRVAAARDAEAIAQLAGILGYPSTTTEIEARLRAIADSPNELSLVAADSADEVLGWLQAHAVHFLASGFQVEILGLVVSSETRSSGVGRALVSAAEDWAKRIDAAAIIVHSNVARIESHPFYRALGYTTIKTQHVYQKTIMP